MGITFSDLFHEIQLDIYADLITSSTLISLAVRIKDLGFITKFNLFLLIIMICDSLDNESV